MEVYYFKFKLASLETPDIYQVMFNHATIGILVVESSGTIIKANAFAENLFGYQPNELEGKSVDILVPDALSGIHQKHRRSYHKKPVDRTMGAGLDLFAKRKDGHTFPVEISLGHATVEDKKVAIAYISNVSEKKRSETLNRDISKIVEESLNEIYIFSADDLKFIQVNKGARQNMGYTQAELKQLTPIDIKPEFSAEKFIKTIQPLVNGQQEKLFFYTVHERKNGTTYPVEVHLQYATFGGQPVFVAFIGDITNQRNNEIALEQEKESAQMYLDIAGSMMVVIDGSENIKLLNQRGQEILGVTETEVMGKNWFDLFVPEPEREEVRRIFDRLVDKKEKNVEYFENSIINKKGEKRLIWWHNRVLIDKDGAVQGTISSGVDITGLRATERQLQASEAKAKILFDYSSIVIWEEDFSEVKRNFEQLRKQGIKDFRTYFHNNLAEVKRLASLVKIKQVNQESLKFYQVDSKEELMTQLSDWFINTSWDVFTEELIALAEGKTDFEGEIVVATPNGEQKHLFMRLAVPPQYQDTFDTVLVSFIDISELKESQRKIKEYSQELEQKVIERTAELRDSEEKLKEAQSIAKMGHWDWLTETRELIFSKGMYQIYGLPDKSDISTELIDKLIHPEDSQCLKSEIDKIIATKKGASINHRIITPDGTLKYVRSNIQAPIFEEKGKMMRLFGVLKDITTQKQSELQLHEALNKEKELGILKSRFVSMASHEFRTPLSSVLSSAELIEMYIEAGKLEKTGRNIARIKNSVRNLTGILNDFLSLEKLEAGKIDVQKTVIKLDEFFDELSEEIKPILRAEQVLKFNNKVGETIQTDPYLLKNILINLVSNAIKYSPNGKDVTLEISQEKRQLIFKVIDQGIGIPPEDQQHMFSRFFRASNVENIKGTGLGLTIVKRYLDLMGGDIGFESEYGKGSTFYFNLPA